MSTTSLFVELVIIGLEVVVWLTLLISSLFDLNWLLYLGGILEKASLLLSVSLFSIAYVLGILDFGLIYVTIS